MNSPQVNRAIDGRRRTPSSARSSSRRPTTGRRSSALYLRVLAREPNAKEVQICGRYLETVGNRHEAFEDILWSLINSTEFITRR